MSSGRSTVGNGNWYWKRDLPDSPPFRNSQLLHGDLKPFACWCFNLKELNWGRGLMNKLVVKAVSGIDQNLLYMWIGLISEWTWIDSTAEELFWIIPFPHAWQYSECSCVHPTIIMKEEIKFILTEFVNLLKKWDGKLYKPLPKICSGAQLCKSLKYLLPRQYPTINSQCRNHWYCNNPLLERMGNLGFKCEKKVKKQNKSNSSDSIYDSKPLKSHFADLLMLLLLFLAPF